MSDGRTRSVADRTGPDDGEAHRSAGRIRRGATTSRDLTREIADLARRLSAGTFELLVLVGEADVTGVWAADGAVSCVAWLAELCEIEASTARSQVRVARAMRQYPQLHLAMAEGDLSYAKARVLVAYLDDENAAELIDLAMTTPVRHLGRTIAAWSNRNEDQETIDDRHHESRYVSWRTDPDGMVTITARLEPAVAGAVCAVIDQQVMGSDAPAGASLGQQRADALLVVATSGGGQVDTEVVVHVRPDGNALSDGTPLTDNVVTALLPEAFVSLLIHDTDRFPIDASPRRRMPTRRQKRVLDERSAECEASGCSSMQFLQYDHRTPYARGGPTTLDNLQRLCGPHNRAKERWDL